MKKDWKERVNELAQEHGPMVYATTYRVLGNCDDAQDAQQDVFLSVMNSWWLRAKAGRVENWGAYLRVASVRSAVSLMKRRRRHAACLLPLDEQIVEDRGPDPRQWAITHQRTTLLRQALCRLPEREARVFILRFFEDCSYEEIAQQMGLSVNRVGVLIHRARERLRKMLEPDLHEPTEQSPGTPSTRPRVKEKSHVA